MKRILTASIIALCCAPALAQQGPPPELPQEPRTVTHMSVSLEDCKRLLRHDMRHEARPDVAYKGGVDVHGNPVVPADLQPLVAIQVPDEIVIDFGLDLAGRYGFGAAALFDATAGIATIQYDLASGALTFNGKSLLDEDAQAIKRACKMRLQTEQGAQ